jgi:hypothetical protein
MQAAQPAFATVQKTLCCVTLAATSWPTTAMTLARYSTISVTKTFSIPSVTPKCPPIDSGTSGSAFGSFNSVSLPSDPSQPDDRDVAGLGILLEMAHYS